MEQSERRNGQDVGRYVGLREQRREPIAGQPRAEPAMTLPPRMPGGDCVQRCTVFAGGQMVASGTIEAVTRSIAMLPFREAELELLAFDDLTGQPIPLVRTHRTRGRPRLGVEARAVMLLPRHWEWLADQPGGASAFIRTLVERAWEEAVMRDPQRHAADAMLRFTSSVTPVPNHLQEAVAAVRAGNLPLAERWTQEWPTDVRRYALRLARLEGLPAARG